MFSMELDKGVVDLALVDFPGLETGAEGGKPWSGYITDWEEVTLPQQEADSRYCQKNVEQSKQCTQSIDGRNAKHGAGQSAGSHSCMIR